MEQIVNETEQTTVEKPKKKKKVMSKKSLIFKKYLFKTLMYAGLFTPMFVLACVNFNKYFATNKDSFSVASGGILIAIFTILLAKIGIKKLHKIITATFLVAIVWCLNSIIKDFLIISVMFWIGIAIYSIFEIPSNYYSKLLNTWNDEEVRMAVRKESKNEIKEDKEEDIYGEI